MKIRNLLTPSSDRRTRYAVNWRWNFASSYLPLLTDRMTILDVGSGRSPAIPRDARPYGCRYVGLDISEEELNAAPINSYDEIYAIDLRSEVPDLIGKVDLAISWQVLEHISPVAEAVSNVYQYLRPNGTFVTLVSGRNAHCALINRIIPERLGVLGMQLLLNRSPDSVFKAHYDSCTYSQLSNLFQNWEEVDIAAHYQGAGYFDFLGWRGALIWCMKTGWHGLPSWTSQLITSLWRGSKGPDMCDHGCCSVFKRMWACHYDLQIEL